MSHPWGSGLAFQHYELLNSRNARPDPTIEGPGAWNDARFTSNISCLVFVAISTALGSAPQTQPSPDKSRHIVLISLDGSRVGRSTIPICRFRRSGGQRAAAGGEHAPVNPTVTWPNHTTLITGVTPAKHGVLFNGLLKRDPGVPPRVEPWLHRDEMVRVKTLYDIAHARGLTTRRWTGWRFRMRRP